MTKKSKPLRAFAPSRETQKEEARPALVPKLRFPEFRGAWETKRLGTLGHFTGGGTPSKENEAYWAGEIPWISSSDLTEDSISQINISRFITKQAVKESATKLVPEKSILLISRVGVGKLAVSTFPLCTSQDFTNFTPTGADTLFLAYLLKSRKETLLSFNQGTSIKGFTKDNIANLELGFPSTAEQQKIAECLSSVDEWMAAQARKVDALKTHKKGLMQQLFPRVAGASSSKVAGASCSHGSQAREQDAPTTLQPRLRFPEFQNAGEWEVRNLGKVAENLDNRRVPITSSERKPGDTPYYGASGIVDYVEGFIFDEDLLCVSEDGANLVARTYPIAFAISGKTWVNNHAHVLRFKNACTQKFVEVYLNSIKLDDFITGMAQPKLNKAMLDRIPIPHPRVPEQQRIAACLSSLDALITAETQKHEALKTHKKGLMQQLFPSPEEVEA